MYRLILTLLKLYNRALKLVVALIDEKKKKNKIR